MKFLVWITILANLYLVRANQNNVCRTISAYLLKTTGCWYDPNMESNTPDIITRSGYPVAVYPITTQDGYILKLIRIPHNGNNANSVRPPVLLQHGMLQDSLIWVDIGNQSLAFVLSNLGYDVWLGNTRGNSLSNEHVKYNLEDKEYWDYTLDSLGHYDTPAVVDFIAKKTKQKIIYIGYSQGATQCIIYAIDNKTLAEENLKGLILLAPAIFLGGGVLNFVCPILEPLIQLLYDSGTYSFGFGQVINRQILTLVCLQTPLQINICKFLWQQIVGADVGDQWSPYMMPAILKHLIDRESTTSLLHLAQICNSKNFEAFNYGKERNIELYGQETPKQYDISKVDLPTYLFYGKSDNLVNYKNVYRLYNGLRSPKYLIEIGGNQYAFNHHNFLYSNRLQEELYPKLLPAIDELQRL